MSDGLQMCRMNLEIDEINLPTSVKSLQIHKTDEIAWIVDKKN